MWAYIRQLNHDHGKTVLMTTHYLEETDSLRDMNRHNRQQSRQSAGLPSELKNKLGGTILTLQLANDIDISANLHAIKDVAEVEIKVKYSRLYSV